MPKRAEVVAAARRWLGTPFHHQGRQLGVGVDCVGVLFGVAWELGLSEFDFRGYHRRPNTDQMTALLNEHLTPIAIRDAREGDVLRMVMAGQPQHLAILTGPDQILHAYSDVGRCVEHRIDDAWRRRIRSAWQFPGLSD